MHFNAFIVAFVSLLVCVSHAAVLQRDEPGCVSGCLNQAITDTSVTSGCKPSDMPCLCKSSDFITAAAECFASQCPTQADAQQGLEYGENFCKSVGVTVSIPPEAASAVGQATGGASSTTATAPATTSSDSSDSSGAVTLNSHYNKLQVGATVTMALIIYLVL